MDESPKPGPPAPGSPPRSASDGGETVDSGAERSWDTGFSLEGSGLLSPPMSAEELGWLAHYRVLKVLGHGGMGVVFQAEDTHLQRVVALKVILPAVAANPLARERFLREARAGAALKSDHVVTIYQVGQDRDIPFLAMEFLEGQTLEDRLSGGELLPLAEVLRIGREAAAGLAAAHARGLIHRDIKPANMWLEAPGGRVKLLDFGLARAADTRSGITRPGGVVGTPEFMSPEQGRGEDLSHRADLFSLGAVLYMMCSGQTPFQGSSTMAVLTALAVSTPRPVRELNAAVPPALAELVERLLAKDPAQRPASADEVREALAAIDAGALPAAGGPRTPSAPSMPALPAPSSPRKSRRAVLIAEIALTVAVLAGVGGLMWWQAPRGTPNANETRPGQPKPAEGPSAPFAGAVLNGGGSTFVNPLMQHWAGIYEKRHGVRLDYQSVGSGRGTEGLLGRVYQFGCSDAPLTDAQLAKIKKDGGEVLHVPLTLGAVVPAYNLPGVSGRLRFTGPILADIYLGKIANWNDPALGVANPGLELPNMRITPVRRADASGTTFIWTDYLSKVSGEWKTSVGAATVVKWPAGLEGTGNNGVATLVSRNVGAVGYLELTYAMENNLHYGQVKNRDGKFIAPSLEHITAAADAMTSIPPDLRLSLTDVAGEDTYPVVGTAYALVHIDQTGNPSGRDLVAFLRWATHEGQAFAKDVRFAPLPPELVRRIDTALAGVRLAPK